MSDKNQIEFYEMEADDASMGFLNPKSSNRDGIYRPNVKDAKDKAKGYVSTIRFLPNIVDGKFLDNAVDKIVVYAKLPQFPELQGYYDSLMNFGEKCPLLQLRARLHFSSNQAEVERAELLSKYNKYYSYVLIVEDEQHPELVGKILVFPYGGKIFNKIQAEKNADNADGKKCNVFCPISGKDFRLIVKNGPKGPNYDSSVFRESSPVGVWLEEKKRFAKPTVIEDENGRKKFEPKSNSAVFSFITTRDEGVNIYNHEAKRWTDEEQANVEKIINYLTGKDVSTAKTRIDSNSTATSTTDDLIEDDFGGGSGDDELDDFLNN